MHTDVLMGTPLPIFSEPMLLPGAEICMCVWICSVASGERNDVLGMVVGVIFRYGDECDV